MKDIAKLRVQEILSALKLNPSHSDASVREANEFVANPGIDDPDLRNLTDLPFVTIDNEDSKDLDQALLMLPLTDSTGFRVLYALADAAWYVKPGSALFEEALQRGVSYYAPGMSVPMLPRSLSEDVVSLNPEVDRRALVFDSVLDDRGRVIRTEIYRARIHSRAKLSYDGVQSLLDSIDRTGNTPNDLPYVDSLLNLREVGELRMVLARQRNVIEYNRKEPQVVVNPKIPGQFEISVRIRNNVERYNEQISLLCNIEGAKLLEKHARLTPELQSVFRIHTPPLAERLTELRLKIDQIVSAHLLDSSWRWSDDTELADYLEALPWDTETRRVRQAIERQIMLTNNASHFSAESGPHHALGVDVYARFSAPMREVVGIFTHKELLEALKIERPQSRAADLALQAQVIAISNRAKLQQKRLDKEFQLLVIERFLNADLGLALEKRPKRRGTLVGMDKRRVYVAVDGFALDLKVYKEDLEFAWGCTYHLGTTVARPGNATASVLRTGDAVNLRTLDWNAERRRFVLELTLATDRT